jgi:ABC-type transport system substrate-binding protein
MADVVKQNLSAIGVQVDLTPLERASLIQSGYVGGNFDMIIDFFALGPDPDIGVERFYNSRNILKVPFVNNGGYTNPEVDALFDQQRAQTELPKRKAIYDRIQELIWDDIPILPMSGMTSPSVMRTSAVTDIFEGMDSTKESFANARFNAAVAASSGYGTPSPAWWVAGTAAALVVAGGGIWARSRLQREDDEAAG